MVDDRLTDLTDQLRDLGEATEAAVAPVTAEQVQAAPPGAQLLEAPADNVADLNDRRRRPSGRILAAAAAVLVVMIGSVVLTGRTGEEATVDVASQPASDWDNGWAALRECESSGDYRIDTGNTFYGAYQFTRSTWDVSAAHAGLDSYAGFNPAEAPAEVQDALAAALYLERGAEPWPVCGREITGPMITPVRAEWLAPNRRAAGSMIIFLEPNATVQEIDATRARVAAVFAGQSDMQIEFFDQAAAALEFAELFANSPAILAATNSNDLPASIRVSADVVSNLDTDLFRAMPNVMAVVENGSPPMSVDVGLGRRLVIPSLGIDVPAFSSPTIANLARGVALHQTIRPPYRSGPIDPLSSYMGPLVRDRIHIAGYSVGPDDAAFSRIDELEEGDVIELQTLTELNVVSVERFTVTIADGGSADEDLALALVTTTEAPSNDPSVRRIVWASRAPVDPDRFG